MKNKILVLLIITIVLLLFPLFYNHYAIDYSEIKIRDVLVTNDNTNVLVYARVSHFTPDLEKAILAGVPTTFSFKIEFYQDEEFWFDKRLAQVEVKKNIKYDQIKKTFYLTSDFERAPAVFQGFDVAWPAIAEINGIPIINTKHLNQDQKYYARIKMEWENYRLPFYAKLIRIFLSFRDFETDWQSQPFHFQQ
ncbi:DUF4390 domain-containing protein [Syntrophus aciditrophicus]|uniref:Hypothetical membrane protein n=1 Tax=Syntrophus aciditrophicus (strain SB) TaxID=56780 RepID=Q2LRW5_SYNAS|nr:DUF4390 domain-containing protein [Syntrophus aciditrophicus]ABC76822.1 hypothetical membrane protein [Syntrophus aciditrophicus SB]OPY17789.1 MAG: hypothetical protein A4E74_01098 [Syntrophus sp. PtaB.Bin075]